MWTAPSCSCGQCWQVQLLQGVTDGGLGLQLSRPAPTEAPHLCDLCRTSPWALQTVLLCLSLAF